ncbi:hypothetical protein DMN91_010113 [Ooceraea biroi]|uniref:Chitin-binding type-2 domain-containing protein n=1 Tax=Ooceraea biroi TaxID=2015173 RepID=A0A026W377_OOCBI|nr:peritrophin-1 [Ooceraea biroi]EZA50478.1 hypothetical protein X777_10671 [Ooceraea biroi]RLU17874.1 hypothetical protein DMN91_010113 [Ooceraea biroi]
MKGTYVLAVAFLASWTVAIASEEELVQPDKPGKELTKVWGRVLTICPFPERFPENTTTNLAHENDCTKFYKCFLGRGVPQLCPYMEKGSTRRLHYNIFEQVCDWPWRAGCTSCPKKDEDGDYLPSSMIPHESGDCSLYYQCDNGVKSLRRCGPNTCFSRTCQRCVQNPRGGVCNGDWDPIPPPTRPTRPPPTRPPLCRTGNRRPHHCNCGKYYECYDDEDWILQECDGGLHFSPINLQCLPPDEARCRLDA